jgi:hypothetical protein
MTNLNKACEIVNKINSIEFKSNDLLLNYLDNEGLRSPKRSLCKAALATQAIALPFEARAQTLETKREY